MFRRYLVPFKANRLPHVLTDALVIGGGVAGLRAALEAANYGDVLLITKTDLKESNTYYAQGGIATVSTSVDSFESHIEDTMTVACGLGNRAAVETVVRDAPARIQELIEWGANFDREVDGALSMGREGGHSYARIIHALGDATGRELANSLIRKVRQHPNIQIMEHTFVLDLVTVDGGCLGAIAFQKDRVSSGPGGGGIFMILAAKRSSPPAAQACSIAKPPIPPSPPPTATPWPSAPARSCATWKWCSFIPRLSTSPAPRAPS